MGVGAMYFNLYEKRKEKNLTLEQLGKKVGVSKGTVKKWESGYIKNMRRDKILRLSQALDVSPMEILLSSDSKKIKKKATEHLRGLYDALLFACFKKHIQKNTAIIYDGDNFIFRDDEKF